MFSGIITAVEPIKSVSERDGLLVVTLKRPRGWRIKKGDSIAVNGVCSTVAAVTLTSFTVCYMSETRTKTTVDSWQDGMAVSLEQPLRLNDFMHGNLVAGHVDGTGTVRAVKAEGASRRLTIAAPPEIMQYVARKGSIAVNGVSLTAASVAKTTFDVALVEYTLQHTTLGRLEKGAAVNLEADLIARYAGRLIEMKNK